jgi:hypothetical protein
LENYPDETLAPYRFHSRFASRVSRFSFTSSQAGRLPLELVFVLVLGQPRASVVNASWREAETPTVKKCVGEASEPYCSKERPRQGPQHEGVPYCRGV